MSCIGPWARVIGDDEYSDAASATEEEEHMATRAEFLKQVWTEVIGAHMAGRWIDNAIAAADRDPSAPFADLGPALKRLLASGANRRDLCLVARHASYETAFTMLYMLGDPGVDDDDIEMLHEELLGADPSGREGREGSTT